MATRPVSLTVFLLVASFAAASGQTDRPITPDTVVVPSGPLHLRALLYQPPGPGPFPAVLFNHGTIADCVGPPDVLAFIGSFASAFVRHGYALLFLTRRGDALSADQGKCMGALLQAEAAKGLEARNHLLLVLLNTEQLDDVLAGLKFLRSLPKVNPGQIAIAGHSSGAMLTLLAAERDTTLQAVVTFAAAAKNWEGSVDLQRRLLEATVKIRAPVMLVHAADDSSTAPAYALANELKRLRKPYVLKILGDHGHMAVFRAVPQWEPEVFRFLATYIPPR